MHRENVPRHSTFDRAASCQHSISDGRYDDDDDDDDEGICNSGLKLRYISINHVDILTNFYISVRHPDIDCLSRNAGSMIRLGQVLSSSKKASGHD